MILTCGPERPDLCEPRESRHYAQGLNDAISFSRFCHSGVDLPAALEFYGQKLGFNVAWTWGTPPDRASVCRGNVEITLSTRGLVDMHGPSRVFIQVTDVDEYFEAIKSSGVEIDVPLDDREYGMRDFHLVDPSGNHLSFGQMIATSA